VNLPQPKNEKEFDSIQRSNPAFDDFIRSKFTDKLPPEVEIKAFENGSCPTFSISGQQVAKFFPDLYLEDFENELKALSFISSSDVGSPRVIAKESFNGWHVILMEQLQGVTLNEIWADLTDKTKLTLGFQAGEHVKNLHLFGIPSAQDKKKWSSFLEKQKKDFFEKQQKLNLRAVLLDQLTEFINSVELNNNDLVFLHTETMADHFMVRQNNDHFSISGLIDFEPAMWGDAEYEFAAAGLFISAGDKKVFKEFLNG